MGRKKKQTDVNDISFLKKINKRVHFDFVGYMLDNNISVADMAASIDVSRKTIYDSIKRGWLLLKYYDKLPHEPKRYRMGG